MSPIDVIIVSAVALALALVVRRALRGRGSGCSSCGSSGSCGSCSAHGGRGGCSAADDMLRRASEALSSDVARGEGDS